MKMDLEQLQVRIADERWNKGYIDKVPHGKVDLSDVRVKPLTAVKDKRTAKPFVTHRPRVKRDREDERFWLSDTWDAIRKKPMPRQCTCAECKKARQRFKEQSITRGKVSRVFVGDIMLRKPLTHFVDFVLFTPRRRQKRK